MTKILVEQGVKVKLQQQTGASQPTIRKALGRPIRRCHG